MEMSYGRRSLSLSSIMGGEARDLLVGPLPNIKETLTWQGRPMIVQHFSAGVGVPFRMELLSDGASELIIVNALDWATHTKAARESDSSASSGSTSDDMAEPVVIPTSGELAANFVRGLEPPQLRHNTLFTVLEMIGNCSLFSDAIASMLKPSPALTPPETRQSPAGSEPGARGHTTCQ